MYSFNIILSYLVKMLIKKIKNWFLVIEHVPLEFWKSVLVPWVYDKTSREKKKPQKNVTYIYVLVQSNLDYPNTGMAHQKFR